LNVAEPTGPKTSTSLWASIGGITVAIALAAFFAYYYFERVTWIPSQYHQYLEAGLVALFGILAILIIGRILRFESTKKLGPERAYQVLDVYRLLAYLVLAFVVLAALGVNGTALLAGGTFAGLVIGLAAQTALGNIFAGILLLGARPFREGDRITLATWQFGFLGPAYPPKFYNDDLLILGFTGVVHSIGLSYSVLKKDDGVIVRLPNSIVIQGAVLSHEVTERWVRTKYEIPPQLDPKTILPVVLDRVRKNKWIARPETVRVTIGAATMASYVLVVDAVCRGAFEDPPRSDILLELMEITGELRGKAELEAKGKAEAEKRAEASRSGPAPPMQSGGPAPGTS
jgi:small-conductance mechanosensitive channel